MKLFFEFFFKRSKRNYLYHYSLLYAIYLNIQIFPSFLVLFRDLLARCIDNKNSSWYLNIYSLLAVVFFPFFLSTISHILKNFVLISTVYVMNS